MESQRLREAQVYHWKCSPAVGVGAGESSRALFAGQSATHIWFILWLQFFRLYFYPVDWLKPFKAFDLIPFAKTAAWPPKKDENLLFFELLFWKKRIEINRGRGDKITEVYTCSFQKRVSFTAKIRLKFDSLW